MKKLLLASIALCFVSALAQAERGDVYLRAGATVIDPESTGLVLSGLGNVSADSAASLTFNIEYMFADSWGIELLAAVPFKHDIELDDTKIGETSHLPPTLTLKWHPTIGRIAPYIGVGANWTIFFNEKLDSSLDSVLRLEDSFGLTAQAGFDWIFGNNWLLNLDVRYIQIETDASVGGALALGGAADLGTVDINPWVYGINFGYKF